MHWSQGLMPCLMRHTIKLWTKISFCVVFQFIDLVLTWKWGGGPGSGVTEQGTHVSLGNLLSFAGVRQGAHTQIRDGDSCTGGQCNQHQQSPPAALQRQLQEVGLLEWECRDIHFTPREVAGIRERRAISSEPLQNLQSTWFLFLHSPNLTLCGPGFTEQQAVQGLPWHLILTPGLTNSTIKEKKRSRESERRQ